jgi:aminoglycoside phosphotransferase family enzyme/predicted kinase
MLAMSRQEQDAGGTVETQRQLVAALRNPARFPHLAPTIAVIETHISFVVLTGTYAYKIKKAVDLGFVDYSSLERRRFFCDEEIRLNRRLAPDLYLEAVPISGDAGHPRLGDASAPFEYAVKMLEFPQDCLLDRLLERNALLPRHIDHLSVTMANFHAAMATAGPASHHGDAAAVQAPMLQNFEQLRAMGATADTVSDLDAVEAWSMASYARLAAVIQDRHEHGFVRECHGDLHLGNMLLREGEVEVFDGIEFNDELRWIDVINEIAFLVMDLSERGRADFGWRFLSDYLEITGDYTGLRLLPFYLVYRAVVRAKVARFRSLQEDLAPDQRAAALASCRAYLAYGRRVTVPQPAALVLMRGLSASGKSHVARILCEQLGAVRIRSDVERKRLHGLAPLARSSSGIGTGLYDAATTTQTYARLLDLARSVAAAGFAAVVDAASLMRGQRDMFRSLAAEIGIPFVIVDCRAPEGVLRQRLVARDLAKGDPSEATLAVLRSQQRTAEPLGDDETACALAVDTSAQEPEGIVNELRQLIGR